MFIKMLDEIKEKLPPKYTKIYPQKNTFSYFKWPPCNVLSPCSQDLSLIHLCCYFVLQNPYCNLHQPLGLHNQF